MSKKEGDKMKEKFIKVKIIKDSDDSMGKEISSNVIMSNIHPQNIAKYKTSMQMRTGFTSSVLNSQKCVICKHYQNQPWVCLMKGFIWSNRLPI